jgi:hypothetical protein
MQVGREERTANDKARVSVKGCFYALPIRFKNKAVQTFVTETEIFVYDSYIGEEIARYNLSLIPGKVIIDRSIIRESKEKLETLKANAYSLFGAAEWKTFLDKTFKYKVRYVRDQCLEAQKYFSNIKDTESLVKALNYCLDNTTYSIGQLKDTYQYFIKSQPMDKKIPVSRIDVSTKNKITNINVETWSLVNYKELIEDIAS